MDTVIDALAGLPADVPADTARDHAAALVLGRGVTLEQANAALVSRNAAPLTANSREVAQAQKDGLTNDANFMARYMSGEADAVAQIFQADLRIQQSKGNLTDRDMAPAEYRIDVAQHLRGLADEKGVGVFHDDMTKLAADLRLPQTHAQTLVDYYMTAFKARAAMSDDERSNWSEKQEQFLHGMLGKDAQAQITAASATLSAIAGRKLDVSAIVKSNGANMAIMLIHQAQALAARK